jgi:hypothetical protein
MQNNQHFCFFYDGLRSSDYTSTTPMVGLINDELPFSVVLVSLGAS